MKYSPAERDTPVLMQDGALQPFDESIGPGMTGLRPRVRQPDLCTGLGKGALEFLPPVREHALQRPPRSLTAEPHAGN